jgi:hypothetical protein
MGKVTSKLREEFEAMVPPTIFFFITLHILALVRSLMLRGAGVPITTTVSVTIAALVLGKVVLIADMLPFINRYPDKQGTVGPYRLAAFLLYTNPVGGVDLFLLHDPRAGPCAGEGTGHRNLLRQELGQSSGTY